MDRSPAPTSRRRVPDFFIAGQPKSGTTALYEMLRSHPQIFMPDCKEAWYFAPELQFRPPPRPAGIPLTLEEYLSLFDAAGDEQRAGEATPLYLWSRTAATRIAEVQPDARIIVILREPAGLVNSLHLQFLKTHVETEPDLRTALSLEEPRRRGEHIPAHSYWPKALFYSEHARYVEQLRRYAAVFPEEQMLVLIYDDFRRDNEGTVRSVLRFLDVDAARSIEVTEANTTVGVRSQPLHNLLHAVSVGRGPVSLAVKGAIKAVTPRGPRRGALRATQSRLVYVDPEPMDQALTGELRRRFKPEVLALSEYLGRDLVTLWGYDGVE